MAACTANSKNRFFSWTSIHPPHYLCFITGVLFITFYIFYKVYGCQIKEYKGLLKRLQKEIKEVMKGQRLKIFFRRQNNIDISSLKTSIEKPLDCSLRMEKAFNQWNYVVSRIDTQLDVKHLKKAEKAIKGIIINEDLCRFH